MASVPFPFKAEEKHLCIERPSKTNPRGLTKEQLIEYARSMGLSVSGNKTDLCDRIFAHVFSARAMPPPAPAAAPPRGPTIKIAHKPPRTQKDEIARLLASMPKVPDKPLGLTPELEKLWETDPGFVKMIMAAPLPPKETPSIAGRPVTITIKRTVAALTAKQVKQMATELLAILPAGSSAADRLIFIIAGKVTKEDADFVLAWSRANAANPRLSTYAGLPKQLKQTGGGRKKS